MEADLLGVKDVQIIGWSLSRARALVHHLVCVHWDVSLEARLLQESGRIRKALEILSPRCSTGGPGVFWTEPFVTGDPVQGELEYGARLIQESAALGFQGGRVGIADGCIAAVAATRQPGASCHRVAPGCDAQFLSALPLDVLPLSPRALVLLAELGIQTIRELQEMHTAPLVARFGEEGRRARSYAFGQDPRQPRAHRPSTITRQEVLFDHPYVHLEPLLYVLRSAMDDLVCGLSRQGQGITCLQLTLLNSDGEESVVEVKPRASTADAALLVRLLERHLLETPPFAEGGAVEGLRVEARGLSTLRVLQGDLFRGHLEAEGEVERMVSRLAQRLGSDAIQVPGQREDHHPDRRGFWSPLRLDPAGESSVERSPGAQRWACVRRLEVPRPVTRLDHRRWRIEEGGPGVSIVAWHGPEVLSGCWWSAPFDRSTYWCLTEDQRVLWMYRDGVEGRWYLQGWLD